METFSSAAQEYGPSSSHSPYIIAPSYSASVTSQLSSPSTSSWPTYTSLGDNMSLPPTSPFLASPYPAHRPFQAHEQRSFAPEPSPTAWMLPTTAEASTAVYGHPDDLLDTSTTSRSSSDSDAGRDISVDVRAGAARPYRCEMCPWAFKRLNNLRTHQERRHNPNARRYHCDWERCNANFSRPQDLQRHKDSVRNPLPADRFC